MAHSIINLPGEIWKPVVGWEGFYEISNMGRARSLGRLVPRDGRCLKYIQGRLIKRSYTQRYVGIGLSRNGKVVNRMLHHLVLEAFIGPRPSGMEACHFNGVRTDNRLDNLRWDTKKANEADKVRLGTASVGENNGRARLCASQVAEIRALRKAGTFTRRELARRFGISLGTVAAIFSGRLWAHVA